MRHVDLKLEERPIKRAQPILSILLQPLPSFSYKKERKEKAPSIRMNQLILIHPRLLPATDTLRSRKRLTPPFSVAARLCFFLHRGQPPPFRSTCPHASEAPPLSPATSARRSSSPTVATSKLAPPRGPPTP